MKYQIIEVRDGNNKVYYELYFWEQVWFKWKWVQLKQYSYNYDYLEIAKFSSVDEAMREVNTRVFKFTVVKEGKV